MLQRYYAKSGKPRRDKNLPPVSIEKGIARGPEFNKTLQEQLTDLKLDLEGTRRNPLNLRYAGIGKRYLTR